jgi:hypothetical protein
VDTPQIGDKFKHPKYPRHTYAFLREESKGDVVWWVFIDVNTGKSKFFYPDEVHSVGEKKRRAKAEKNNRPVLEGETKSVVIGGEEVTIT